jgi:hypothetical protein
MKEQTMPKLPAGSKRFDVWLPGPLARRLEEHLKGHPDGKIPKGEIVRYFVNRTREHLNRSQLRLGKYPGFAADAAVTGSETTLAELARILESQSLL